MRILLVGYTVPQSGVRGMGLGISRYTYHLGKELVDMGQEVELVVRDDFKPKEKWIKTAHAPKFGWYPYPFFLKNRLRNSKADVFNADYVVTGAPLAWLGKKPLSVIVHDALPFHYDNNDLNVRDRMFVRFYKYCFRSVEKKADALIMSSENAREDMINYTKVDEDRIFVVYPGVDTKFFHPMKKNYHEKIRIGYLGGLDARKNTKLLVEVFRKMVAKRNDIELHVGGAGASLEKFKSMKIPNAKFYGFIPIEKQNEFLNLLDIFVYPTLGEGFGMPPLEAMAAGLPVLSSDTTSMPEVVGGAGITAEPTVEAFNKELTRLVDDKKLRNKIANNCLKRAEKMTWRQTAEQSLEVYETIQ